MVNKTNTSGPTLLQVPTQAPQAKGGGAKNTKAQTSEPTQGGRTPSKERLPSYTSVARGKENAAPKDALVAPRLTVSFAAPDGTPFSPLSAVSQSNVPRWLARTTAGAVVPYDDRKAVLRESPHLDKPVLTVAVFSSVIQTPGARLDDRALENPMAWVSERRAVQKVATDRIKGDALKLDARIAAAKAKQIAKGDTSVDWSAPIIVFLRGNSGAGKSSTVRSALPEHLAVLDIAPRGPGADDDMGALNPDDAKYVLQGEDKRENITTTSQQYAYEGSICANRVFAELIQQERNVVFDKRFLQSGQIEVYLDRARAINPNYRAVIVDIEAPLKASADAVLSRPEQGRSPNVPWQAIQSGFTEAREHRTSILELAQKSPATEYYCFSRPPIEALKAGANITLLAAKGPAGHVAVADPKGWDRAQHISTEERADIARLASEYAGPIDAKATKVTQD